MTDPTQPSKGPLLNDKLYDFLKRFAVVVLPAFGAFYFTVAQIWGLPKAEEVVGTIAAVNVFVGVIVQLANRSYNKREIGYDGSLNVSEQHDGVKMFTLDLSTNPDALQVKDEVRFKVNK